MQTGFIRNNNQVQILRTAKEVLGDLVLCAPAIITAPRDVSKYGQLIEIVNTIDDLVANEIETILDKGNLLIEAVKRFRKVNKYGKLFIIPLQDDIDVLTATKNILANNGAIRGQGKVNDSIALLKEAIDYYSLKFVEF